MGPDQEGELMEVPPARDREDREVNREAANELALEVSIVAPAIRAVAEKVATDEGGWTGKASELLKLMNEQVDDAIRRQDEWPRSPQALRNHLNRIAPNLREIGIDLTFGRNRRKRWITMRASPEQEGKSSSQSSQASPDAVDDDPVATCDDPVTTRPAFGIADQIRP